MHAVRCSVLRLYRRSTPWQFLDMRKRHFVLTALTLCGWLHGQTLLETFSNAPDYTNNWQLGVNQGGAILTYTPGNLRLQASRIPFPPVSAVGLISNQTFCGDIDVTFELNHQGFGQTKVGLYGLSASDPLVFFDLDTDDVACLWMNVPGSPVRNRCPSSAYLNRWLTLRITIVGNQAEFYADGALLETIPYPAPAGAYRAWFSVSSVPWKSGDNDSSFRLVTASGTPSCTPANAPPVITSLTGPTDPLAIGASATVTADFTDANSLDTHTCSFDWDDGLAATPGIVTESGGAGSCTASQSFGAAGVYEVGVTVTDNPGASDTEPYQFVVVYDPSAGFVTGGGWIDSLPGAYGPDPNLWGKASFGFVARYQKGANVPTGQTQFQFRVADFNFHSTTYDWLVIAGPKAQYKGSGTINGAGDYAFLLTATDGQRPGGGGEDRFRIKIWNKGSGGVIYDNARGSSDDIDDADPQVLGGGSITIQSN